MKGGFVASPFNPRMQIDELDYIINYSEVKILFVGPEFTSIADQLKPRLKHVTHYISLEGKAENMLCHEDLLGRFSQR